MFERYLRQLYKASIDGKLPIKFGVQCDGALHHSPMLHETPPSGTSTWSGLRRTSLREEANR